MTNLRAKHATPLAELVTQRLQQRQQQVEREEAQALEVMVRQWFAEVLSIDLPELAVVRPMGEPVGRRCRVAVSLLRGARTVGTIASEHHYEFTELSGSGVCRVVPYHHSAWRAWREGASTYAVFEDFVDAAIYLQGGK